MLDHNLDGLSHGGKTVYRNFTNVVFGVISLHLVGFFPVFPMIW